MKIPQEKAAEIRRLYSAEHWRVGTLASQFHLHRDTVKRVLGVLPGQGPRPVDASVVAPYLPFIQETLQAYPTLRATRLYDMVKSRGYQGSARHLRRLVAPLRPTPRAQAFLHIETLPGEQAQVDWAHAGKLPVEGGHRDLWLFVMVLSYSRALWAEFVLDLTVHQVVRSLVRASAFFQGCPRQWLFDNPKTVVLERQGDAVRYHPDLLAMADALRVQPRLCQVRKPTDKGRVERAIRYLRDRFLDGRIIGSVESGNAQLLEFIRDVADQRPHPTQKTRTVGQVLAEERLLLLALPDPMPVTLQQTPVHVDGKAFIHFDTNLYSVPWRHAGQVLVLTADDVRLRVLDKDNVVAEHPRCYGRHQRFELPAHRAELVAQRRAARAAKGRDRLLEVSAHLGKVFEQWLHAGRNMGSCTQQVLKLLDLYGDAVLRQAVEDIVNRNIHDVSALAVRCEHHWRQKSTVPPAAPVAFGTHVRDRDVVQHALEGYDDDK